MSSSNPFQRVQSKPVCRSRTEPPPFSLLVTTSVRSLSEPSTLLVRTRSCDTPGCGSSREHAYCARFLGLGVTKDLTPPEPAIYEAVGSE